MISIIPLWAKLLIALAIVAVIWGDGAKVGYDYAKGKAEVAAAQIEKQQADAILKLVAENDARAKAFDAQSQVLQAALVQTRVVTRYVSHRVAVEVDKPVYKECLIPTTGVNGIIDYTTRYNSIRQPQK